MKDDLNRELNYEAKVIEFCRRTPTKLEIEFKGKKVAFEHSGILKLENERLSRNNKLLIEALEKTKSNEKAKNEIHD